MAAGHTTQETRGTTAVFSSKNAWSSIASSSIDLNFTLLQSREKSFSLGAIAVTGRRYRPTGVARMKDSANRVGSCTGPGLLSSIARVHLSLGQ